jgi:hypothetical protein
MPLSTEENHEMCQNFQNWPKFKAGTFQVSSLVMFLSKVVIKCLHLTERRSPASYKGGPGPNLDPEISHAD